MNTPVQSCTASVSVIIITHESGDELEALLPELIAGSFGTEIEIIVVDNASSDRTVSILDGYRDRIKSILNERNAGFGTAVNQALNLTGTPWILLLNPDARLPVESIRDLRDYLVDHPGVAAAAPRLEFPDGRIQPSRGSFPSVFRTAVHLFGMKRLMPEDDSVIGGPLSILGRVFKQYAPLVDYPQRVDYTTGACVMLRRSAIEDAGGFDEHFFLYYEEIDLAKRLKAAGYEWMFLSHISAVHSVAASSGKAPLRPFYERYRSMCYYFRKHHSSIAAFIVRHLLYLMVLTRWGLVLVSNRFRLDPGIPLQQEIEVYRKLLV